MYIEPAERYLPKTYMQFSIMDNNNHKKGLWSFCQVTHIEKQGAGAIIRDTGEGQSSLESEDHSHQFYVESSPVCTVTPYSFQQLPFFFVRKLAVI